MAKKLTVLQAAARKRGAYDATGAWADVHGDTARTYVEFVRTLNPALGTQREEALQDAYTHYAAAFHAALAFPVGGAE